MVKAEVDTVKRLDPFESKNRARESKLNAENQTNFNLRISRYFMRKHLLDTVIRISTKH